MYLNGDSEQLFPNCHAIGWFEYGFINCWNVSASYRPYPYMTFPKQFLFWRYQTIFFCLIILPLRCHMTSYHVSYRVITSITCFSYKTKRLVFLIWINKSSSCLAHWGRATHICVNRLTGIGSGNGLSSGRSQAIILTNVRILLIGPSLGTNLVKFIHFHSGKCIWKYRLENGGHFVSASMC